MAGQGELKLLGYWASPYVARVRIALHLKGLSYELVEDDLSNKSDLLLKSNPVYKAVPVLFHNGKPICESLVIMQYIDEVFDGPSLFPTDPYERSIARFWAAYVEDQVVAPWKKVFDAKTPEEGAKWMNQTFAAVGTLEEGLKECSQGKSFFGGDNIGYVDILLGGLLSWVRASDTLSGAKLFDDDKAPLLAAWMKRFCELDVAKTFLQDVDKVIEYAKMVQARSTTGAAHESIS